MDLQAALDDALFDLYGANSRLAIISLKLLAKRVREVAPTAVLFVCEWSDEPHLIFCSAEDADGTITSVTVEGETIPVDQWDWDEDNLANNLNDGNEDTWMSASMSVEARMESTFVFNLTDLDEMEIPQL